MSVGTSNAARAASYHPKGASLKVSDCSQITDGAASLHQAVALRPDLVLLDLSMPGMTGLEVLPAMRDAVPDCEIVVLTASGTEDNLLAAIRGGAAGYLLKTEPPERIAEFLHGVVRGEAALSGEIARRLLDQVRDGRPRVHSVPDDISNLLSARELEVLLLRKLGVSSRREALETLATARAY